MKFKVTLGPGETPQEAESLLAKALQKNNESFASERYVDNAVNQFHDYVEAQHRQLVEEALKEVAVAIDRDISSRGY